MSQLDLFPKETNAASKVFFVNFGEKEELYLLPILAKLRNEGISCEIFPDSAKMKKQMNYANRKEIPFVVLAGDSEIEAQKVTLKNMSTGDLNLISIDQLLTEL
ncbi:MAG: His/Gly/Thr/Pro-type tRNA ligase C-terminal domain-containing protein [Prolixibacteraceae bacterium]|jgi:histidyl-tRNA synthetase|nr:His/Gly/Thr/Pro-type tRNA ligase C-terminal domain-containing protein [Prolixibacteraceae bacterium]